jgi:WD40 repeat protein
MLWDVRSRRLLHPRRPFAGDRLAISPDGRFLAAGSLGGQIRLWETGSWRERGTVDGLAGAVQALAFASDSKTLATAHQDGTVILWNAARLQTVATLVGHEGPVNAVAFSPDGSLLATAGDDRTIRLWRAASFAQTDAAAGPPH